MLFGVVRPGPAARALLSCALAAVAVAAAATGLTPAEEAGRRVYVDGVGATGVPITALVGPALTPVPGETLPCANCHGADGLGKPEGAVKPSNITWQELTKPYGHRHENGREHGPFSEQSLATLLTEGMDPAANRVDPTMPRYVMANSDIANLVTYIKRIEADLDPGVSGDRLRIGTLVPTTGRLAELGQAALGIMQGHADQINAHGGLFGRRIELVVAEYSEEPGVAVENVERLLREQGVFALVSPFSAGIEKQMAVLAEKARIPVVGPFTLFPDTALAVNRYTFYLLPGLREQGRALAEFAAKDLKLGNPPVAIVYPDNEGNADTADAVEETLRNQGWTQVRRNRYPPGQMPAGKLVAELQQGGAQVVFFLGTDADLAAFGRQVRDAIWSPYLLAPGSRVARAAMELPATFGNRVYLAYPTAPADITREAAADLGALETKRQLGPRHKPAQVAAYGAMRVLEEALKRAGRDLSRAKLAGALENLYSFDTGVMPSISYGPTRRIGALGAHIVGVDLSARQFRPTGRYIRLD